MIRKLLLLFILFFSWKNYSQLTPITPNTQVSILTVGTANESHSLYGHTALRIQDASNGFDYIYNYGMFDFSTENFILKFVKGDMQYYAAAYSYEDFEYNYRIENRSIYEQVLDLSLEEKQLLFEKLSISLNPETKYYTYKFIDRNCTTKVVDILNEVLKNKPIEKKNSSDKTYREVLFPYAKNHFYEKLGINIIFGTKVDELETKIFLPFDLYENLKIISYKNKPLVKESKTLFEATSVAYTPPIWDNMYTLIGILLIVILLNNKLTNITYFSLIGVIGLLFSFIGLYSFHKEILWNYNIFLFNPIYLVIIYFICKNNLKWLRKTAFVCLFSLLIYILLMINKVHLFIVLPIIITNSILLLRLIIKKEKLLPSVK
jgi:hypothetical protein